jgi:hypothetical protein
VLEGGVKRLMEREIKRARERVNDARSAEMMARVDIKEYSESKNELV